jgi:hypothetical protein
MSTPTLNQVHTDEVLTNISVAYFQNQTNFVADKVFPIVPVQKQSDLYRTFNREDFNRVEAKILGPGAPTPVGGFGVSSDTYYCHVYAIGADLHKQVEANADAVLRLRQNTTRYVTYQLMQKREKDFMTEFMAASKWTNDYAGVSSSPTGDEVLQWNDESSTPIENVRFAKRTILESTGFEPNKLVVGQAVFDALIDHPDIVDRIKYGQTQGGPAVANEQALAQILGVESVMVSKAIENTAKQGDAEVSAFMAGKKALLVHAPATAGLELPSAGYTFTWAGYNGLNDFGINIDTYVMRDNDDSERVRGRMAYDQEIISADLGFFWDAIVA